MKGEIRRGVRKGRIKMKVKDSFIGTARRVVAEAVGNFGLAEKAARQTGGNDPSDTNAISHQQSTPLDTSSAEKASLTDENRFGALLGHAALRVWSDLPREAQEQLFAAAVDDGVIANSLAVFLHDHHPKTAHPPKPTLIA